MTRPWTLPHSLLSTVMKTRSVSCLWFALLASSACDLETEGSAFEQADLSPRNEGARNSSVFRVDVGAPIDAAIGSRWMDNYRRATGNEAVSYTIPSATLRQELAAAGSVGIRLQYGTDDAGGLHIFPSGVDSAGRLLTVMPADARRFIDQYRGGVKSHFFGRNTFVRLLDEGRCEAVRATLALDDALAPQLLLSDAAEKEPRSYEDMSHPI